MLYSYLQSDNKFKYVPFPGLALYFKWEVRLSSRICSNMVNWCGLGSPLLAWTTLPLSHTFRPQRPLFCSRTEQTSTLELLVRQVWLQMPPTSSGFSEPQANASDSLSPKCVLAEIPAYRPRSTEGNQSRAQSFTYLVPRSLCIFSTKPWVLRRQKIRFYSSKLYSRTVCPGHKQVIKPERRKLTFYTEICVCRQSKI